MKYSFLTSVYKNTKQDELCESLQSLYAQTLPSSEIVIVEDGAIEQSVDAYLTEQQAEHPEIKRVKLEKNCGLGLALQKGLEACSNELVARIDADDVSSSERMEIMTALFEKDPELDVAGSNMSEFEGDISNIVATRVVPETHEEICAYMKKRCPLNHITVVFKKSSVLKAGNYSAFPFNEDYYLWVRMYLSGCKFYNVQKTLCSARVGKEMYRRRGGLAYFKSERNLFRFMKKNKMISYFSYLKAVSMRFLLQILMPNGLRQWVFLHFARKRVDK